MIKERIINRQPVCQQCFPLTWPAPDVGIIILLPTTSGVPVNEARGGAVNVQERHPPSSHTLWHVTLLEVPAGLRKHCTYHPTKVRDPLFIAILQKEVVHLRKKRCDKKIASLAGFNLDRFFLSSLSLLFLSLSPPSPPPSWCFCPLSFYFPFLLFLSCSAFVCSD